jgi:uncharacterized damage-inducible protein DinB
MIRHLVLVTAVAGLVGITRTHAQTSPATPTSGYRFEFLRAIDTTETQYLRLAEAIPAEKYTWRPGEGVRSVSEVFLHVATANYGTPTMLGVTPPAGIRLPALERSTTEKAEVIAALRESFAHLRRAVLATADADQDKPTRGWLGPTTYRGAVLIMNGHLREHLGQAIAYARVNGVVPPWSAGGQ